MPCPGPRQSPRGAATSRISVAPSFEGERERFGQQELYTTMDNQGYNNNVDRMMARCMEARGWAPKQQNWSASWWTRLDLRHRRSESRSAASSELSRSPCGSDAQQRATKNSTITPSSTSTKASAGMA